MTCQCTAAAGTCGCFSSEMREAVTDRFVGLSAALRAMRQRDLVFDCEQTKAPIERPRAPGNRHERRARARQERHR